MILPTIITRSSATVEGPRDALWTDRRRQHIPR